MSSSTSGRRPAPGRPSRAVYRRRRLVALLIVLLLVAAAGWGLTTLLRGGEEAGAAPDDAAEPAGATDAASGQASDDAESAEPEAPSGEVVACVAADLGMSLALDPPAPSAGDGVSIAVTVRNDGELPCLLDAGPASLVASVSSGSDPVWSSAHCAGDATNELLLDTGTETTVAVSWNGRRSAEGCPGDQAQAGAGTYRAFLSFAGEPLEEDRVFTLG